MSGSAETALLLGLEQGWLSTLGCWLASFKRSHFPCGCEKRAAGLALSRAGLYAAPFPLQNEV